MNVTITLPIEQMEALLDLASRAEAPSASARMALSDAKDQFTQETQVAPSYEQPTLFDPTPYEVQR